MNDALLTGKALVAELQRLDLGVWTPDAVRQWIREEPACPIAAPAQQGAPHRYQLDQVLDWLKTRAEKERVKLPPALAHSSLAEKIARLRAPQGGGGEAARHSVHSAAPAIQLALVPSAPSSPISPSKHAPEFSEEEIAALSDLELMRNVLRGRDPRNWESAERALRLHRENRLEEGAVVPVQDLENTLASQAIAMRNACGAMVSMLAQRLPDNSSYAERAHIIRVAMDQMLDRLSREDPAQLDVNAIEEAR